MDYAHLDLFMLMKNKMQYLSERQGVLAENIANADTPGYAARDIAKPDFGKALSSAMGRLNPLLTDPSHMPGAHAASSQYDDGKRKTTFETNPNENKVSVEEEVQKMSMNQTEYQQVALMYRKTVEMFKTAIGRPGSA